MNSLRCNSYIDSFEGTLGWEQKLLPLLIENPACGIPKVKLPKIKKSNRSKTPNGRVKSSQGRNIIEKNDSSPTNNVDLHINILKVEELLSNEVKSPRQEFHITWKKLRPAAENLIIEPDLYFLNPKKLNPLTKAVHKTTKRIQIHRRLDATNKCVIVINFEGVIGDVFKHNIWDIEPAKLYMRRQAIKGIKALIKEYQVVLFVNSSRVKVSSLIEYFSMKNIKFDGVYRALTIYDYIKDQKLKKSNAICQNLLKSPETLQNYRQISIDFGIQNQVAEKMLVIASTSLDSAELKYSSGTDLLFRKGENRHFQCLCKGIPTESKSASPLPITLIVPDPRANPSYLSISFNQITKSLTSLSNEPIQSWLNITNTQNSKGKIKLEVIETSFFQYALGLKRFNTTSTQVNNYLNEKIPKNNNIHTSFNGGTNKKQKISSINKLKDKNICKCPSDIKKECLLEEYKTCNTEKFFLDYLVNGKEIPSMFMKNTFIVLKPKKLKFPYRIIQEEIKAKNSHPKVPKI
ncbi:unnamed protein product [Blepharisma stoltei]|uniref:Uncharacterized protein n=1 Tax=Blepharisma stoltei TaxID=1481888 RepID=A0AAU9IBH4_9CILI|nr:unnamed protein product [Blepharisma stoltei]